MNHTPRSSVVPPAVKARPAVVGIIGIVAGVIAGIVISNARHKPQPPAAPHVTAAPTVQGANGDFDAARLERLGIHFAPVRNSAAQATIDVVGMLELDRTRLAEVSTHAAGRIITLRARVGMRVAHGDVLAQVESPAIGEAAANYRVHGAELRTAQQHLTRLQGLRGQGLATEREIELAEAAVRTATANQQADNARLHAYGLGPQHLDGNAPLIAPIDGEVIRSSVVLGSWLQPETEAFVVADLSTLWAELDVPESDLGAISLQNNVMIDVPSLGRRDVPGRVEHIHAEVDASTRMGRVRVAVPNADGHLRAGLSLTAHIRPEERAGAVHIAPESVRHCEAGSCVLVRRDGRARWVPVDLGPRGTMGVEVRHGVNIGDEIAVAGLGLLGGT